MKRDLGRRGRRAKRCVKNGWWTRVFDKKNKAKEMIDVDLSPERTKNSGRDPVEQDQVWLR